MVLPLVSIAGLSKCSRVFTFSRLENWVVFRDSLPRPSIDPQMSLRSDSDTPSLRAHALRSNPCTTDARQEGGTTGTASSSTVATQALRWSCYMSMAVFSRFHVFTLRIWVNVPRLSPHHWGEERPRPARVDTPGSKLCPNVASTKQRTTTIDRPSVQHAFFYLYHTQHFNSWRLCTFMSVSSV